MIVQRIFFFSDVFENSPSSEVHERGARNTDQNLADQDESNLEKSEQCENHKNYWKIFIF
jgi:hypothetical protein